MRIAFVTAGAAGMFCGSCMRDNTLVAALGKLGHDALLVPTYTPIRTDDADVSDRRIFFGGVNVYLEQKLWLFRHTPAFLDRLFNFRRLLKWVSPLAQRTKYSQLGDLTASMLRGTHGHQRKEVAKLTDWLGTDIQPEVVLLTNVLLSGIVPALKQKLGVPVLATLQGDDIFLDALPAADRARCLDLIRDNCRRLDGFLVTSRDYADRMARHLGLPREKMRVVYPGINLAGHGGSPAARPDRPPTMGYFARVCPEKGFHHAVSAFLKLRQTATAPPVRFRASGWLGAQHKPFFAEQVKRIQAAGLSADFDHIESPTHADKVEFFRSIDVLTVPTVYEEPKGLFVLEAWANGVPVVQPRHGSFPEVIGDTGGGLLVEPGNTDALAAGLQTYLTDEPARVAAGRAGELALRERYTAESMARATVAVLEQLVHQPTR